MAIHISELSVDTYRGIKNLKIDNLADINIITGDNNAGKTSILELIQNLNDVIDINTWLSPARGIYERISKYEKMENLFNINNDDKCVSYAVTMRENAKRLKIGLKADKELLTLSKNEMLEIQGVLDSAGREILNNYASSENEKIIEDVERYVFEIYCNDECNKKGIIYNFTQARIRSSKEESLNIIKTIYISPVQHAEGRMFLSDVLDDAELYQEMLEVLKEFDENIISINADKTNNLFSSTAIYKILSKNQKRALPLNVYGDGMKKAVLLMSAVVKAKDGILILDEFETAIHTSAMDRVFRWILESCKKLNVQLFITSHSKEAIDKVLKCAPELQNSMRLITLYKKPDKVVARVLDGVEAIETQDELGLELR